MKEKNIIVENDNLLIPALWIGDHVMIAYSKKGYKNRLWELPLSWEGSGKLRISRITTEGKTFLEFSKLDQLKLSLSLAEDEMVLIEKL